MPFGKQQGASTAQGPGTFSWTAAPPPAAPLEDIYEDEFLVLRGLKRDENRVGPAQRGVGAESTDRLTVPCPRRCALSRSPAPRKSYWVKTCARESLWGLRYT